MGWDYVWKIGPKDGTLVAVSTYATASRLVGEVSAGRRGTNPVAQYRHGTHFVSKWAAPLDLMYEIAVRYTSAAGTVTHTDGAAGHVYENLAEIKRLLSGEQGGLATIQQTAPDWGTVQLDVEVASPPQPTQQRFVFGFLLHAADPFWRNTTLNTETGTSVVVGGNAPAAPIIDFVSGTDMRVTHTGSGAYIQIDGAAPAGGVRVDVREGTCIKISDSTDYSAYLTVNKPWWMELDGGKTNAVTKSGGGTSTVKWYNRWR